MTTTLPLIAVRSSFILSNRLKRLTQFTTFAACSLTCAQAQTYLIDLNDTAGSARPAGTWNVYANDEDVNGSSIVDNTNAGSAITLSQSGDLTDSSATAFNNSTGGPSWVTTDGSLANTGAAADYFYTSTGSETSFTLTFGSLNQGDQVNLDLWAPRDGNGSAIGLYSYSLDGVTWAGFNVLEKDGSASTGDGIDAIAWNTTNTLDQAFRNEIDGNDEALYMNVSAILIGSEGTLHIKVQDTEASNFATLSAMKLTVIPEPHTFALLAGFCGLTVTMLRRRRV